jgi:hypothetical protein
MNDDIAEAVTSTAGHAALADRKQPAGPQSVIVAARLRPCQVLDFKGSDRNGTHGTQIFTDPRAWMQAS